MLQSRNSEFCIINMNDIYGQREIYDYELICSTEINKIIVLKYSLRPNTDLPTLTDGFTHRPRR